MAGFRRSRQADFAQNELWKQAPRRRFSVGGRWLFGIDVVADDFSLMANVNCRLAAELALTRTNTPSFRR